MAEPPSLDTENLARRDCAYVYLVEVVNVLLPQKLDQHEQITLRQARRLAVHQLRQLVIDSDPAIMAQIMVARDK